MSEMFLLLLQSCNWPWNLIKTLLQMGWNGKCHGKMGKWVKYVWNRRPTSEGRRKREREIGGVGRQGNSLYGFLAIHLKNLSTLFNWQKRATCDRRHRERNEGRGRERGERVERLMQFAAEHEKGCVPATLTHCTGAHRTRITAPAPAPAPVGVDSASFCLRCLECDSSISAICHINTNQHTHTYTYKQKHMSIHISLRICLCGVWYSCNACPLSCSWMRWHLALANCQLLPATCHLPPAAAAIAAARHTNNCIQIVGQVTRATAGSKVTQTLTESERKRDKEREGEGETNESGHFCSSGIHCQMQLCHL